MSSQRNPYRYGPWAPIVLDPAQPDLVVRVEDGFLIRPDGASSPQLRVPMERVFDLITPAIRDLEVKAMPGTHARDLLEVERLRWQLARFASRPFGRYAYFPDKGDLVHYPAPELWEAAQTISSATLYRDFGLQGSFEEMRAAVRREVPAVAGCSVGRRIAEGLSCYHMEWMKLADKKAGHPSGNNRAPHTYEEMTRHDSKAISLARRFYAEDGLTNLSIYKDGIHPDNVSDFVAGNPAVGEPPASIVFEETDDLVTKLDLRVACHRAHVPYAMITDLGRFSLIDYYDFTRRPELPLVAGQSDERTLELLDSLRQDPENFFLKRVITMALVGGVEMVRGEMRSIIQGVNQRAGDRPPLTDPPQDGSTCIFGGVAAAHLLLEKVAGTALSGRRLIDPLKGELFRQNW